LKAHRVRVLKRAERDLFELRAYLRREAPDSADRVIGDLLDAIESLARWPERGARPRDERLRRRGFRFLARRLYLIFFKISGRSAWVYRVLHGKRAWSRLL
jgi:plasmid stabilization system protein ParE